MKPATNDTQTELNIDLTDISKELTSDSDPEIKDSVSLYLREISQYDILTPEEEQTYFTILKKGKDAERRLSSEDSLSDEEKASLNHLILDGKDAKDQLTLHNLRLVVYLVRPYIPKTKTLTIMDLIQVGTLGLIHAIDKFNPSKGYRLSTYAVNWIQSYVRREILACENSIRIPEHVYSTNGRYLHEINKKEQELGRKLTTKEKEAIFPNGEIPQAFTFCPKTTSLNKIVGDQNTGEDTELQDLISDDNTDIEDLIEKEGLKQDLDALMKRVLTDRDYYILCSRFGLNDTPIKSLEQIGQELGISRERVRQRTGAALRRLYSTRGVQHFQEYLQD